VTNGCRIGKIKLKNGAELHRLPVKDRDEAQRRLIDRAAMISGFYKPGEMVGYVVMGWDKDGFHSVGYLIDPKSVVGRTMLPSFVADALRRRMIEDGDWERL
jgi:hypothetical protein